MPATSALEYVAQLEDLLEPGDIILDGGNSFFEDTRRRYAHLKEKGIPVPEEAKTTEEAVEKMAKMLGGKTHAH